MLMEDLTRRSFMGTVGALGMAALVPTALASEGNLSGSGRETTLEGATGAGVANVTTPLELEALGESTMSLHELNRLRHEYVDSREAYTKADGTVVPAPFVKLRALTNTYHVGCGSEVTDECFDFFMMLFSEDEAQAYLEMPFGTLFTAGMYAEESGRPEDECVRICEDLSDRKLLFRCVRGGEPWYHQLALAHGYYELGLNDYFKDGWTQNYRAAWTSDYATGYMNSGTPFYYAIPCGAEVVGDEGVLPIDDYERIMDRAQTVAVAPCQCRKIGMSIAGEPEPPAVHSLELRDFTAPCGHPLETCIATGEMAEYYIEHGIGRQITNEEGLAILKRSIDNGMILQASFTKDSYVICSCHGDCCRILGVYKAAGLDACAVSNTFPNNSHYNLVWDEGACIGCGACAERCPMDAITMEDGKPVVNAFCMRCGQCGLVCPADARKLYVKDASEYPERPLDLMGDYNLKAAYRFEHGTIY